MAGNVWEWCQDELADINSNRVLRGGSYENSIGYLQVAHRRPAPQDLVYMYYGFRCVLEPITDVSEASTDKVEIHLLAEEIPASPSSSTTVTIIPKSKDGWRIKGETVNLTVDKGTIQTPAIDNGDGSYTAKYTAGNVAGEAKITAITSNGKFAFATITLLDTQVKLSA